jgi:hypothetical protein
MASRLARSFYSASVRIRMAGGCQVELDMNPVAVFESQSQLFGDGKACELADMEPWHPVFGTPAMSCVNFNRLSCRQIPAKVFMHLLV